MVYILWNSMGTVVNILQTLKCYFEDLEVNPERKQDAKNLYHKLIKVEYGLLTFIQSFTHSLANHPSS